METEREKGGCREEHRDGKGEREGERYSLRRQVEKDGLKREGIQGRYGNHACDPMAASTSSMPLSRLEMVSA